MARERGPDLPDMTCMEKIGKGGYSQVWLYEQHRTELKVAVKVLSAEVLSDGQRAQFEAEARVMAEMDHPNIVQVYGAGTTGDGRPYLVMKYYPPPDLGERVAGKPMSVEAALRTGVELASAVETAHQRGVIHRDIKPANVLVNQYGVALTDFGIAGRGDLSEGGDDLGVSMPWSPPEVLSGKSNGSPTSDVYSLAATVWHLLVGHSPFAVAGDVKGHEQFKAILHGRRPVTGRAEVPSSLDRLLQGAMAIDPTQRPQSAIDFARHLNRIEQERRLDRTKIVVPEQPSKPAPAPAPTPPVAPVSASQAEAFAPPTSVATPPTSVAPPAPATPPEVDESATMLQRPKRPQSVAPPPGKAFATSSRTTSAPADVSSELTGRRPVAPPADEPTKDAPAVATRGRGLLMSGGVALLVVIAIAIAIGLANHGGDSDSPALPGPTSPSDIGDVIDGFQALTPPDITVVANGGAVTFSATPEEASDVFEWRARTGSRDYQKVTPDAGGRSVTITGAKKACVELRVRRESAGALSDPEEKCWP